MTRKTARTSLRIKAVRLAHGRDLALPSYQSAGAAGMDLLAAVEKPVKLKPGARALIPTGLILEIPRGYEAQIRPRSGLAFRHGISLPNTPGTIDSDYRGEVQVLLINLGDKPFAVTRGERIAQLVVQRVERAELTEVLEVTATRRGGGGFGSTGTSGTPAAQKRKSRTRKAGAR